MVQVLHQKGYRGRFAMSITVRGRAPFFGDLTQCLHEYLTQTKQVYDLFILETKAPYRDELRCEFTMDYDDTKGFLIRHLKVTDTLKQEQKLFPVENNQLFPGSQTIGMLFPKEKPWNRHLKGGFRP